MEQLRPQEIVKRLSQPIKETVDRTRKKLAEKNRHLLDDEQYAWRHQRRREK